MRTLQEAIENLNNPLSESLDNDLLKIAKKHFQVSTLAKRNSDSKDFHDVAIWDIKDALTDAYNLGKKSK